METVKILSVCTGISNGKGHSDYEIKSTFEVATYPYNIDFYIGCTLIFGPESPSFDLKFDVYDDMGEELNKEVSEFEPDYERFTCSEEDILSSTLWLRPSDHQANRPGIFTVVASVIAESGKILDKIETRFILSKSWAEVE
jgi:hypothetical protein